MLKRGRRDREKGARERERERKRKCERYRFGGVVGWMDHVGLGFRV